MKTVSFKGVIGRWNEKTYSSREADCRIYVSNQEFHISNQELEELKNQDSEMLQKEAWKEIIEREGIEENPTIPTNWNHFKCEYAALIDKEGKRDFITERTGFSSSGKNANLKCSVDINRLETGTLLEVKDGSHKNMRYNLYRKDEDGWKLLCTRDGSSKFYSGRHQSYAEAK
jgi:hypothetical protein